MDDIEPLDSDTPPVVHVVNYSEGSLLPYLGSVLARDRTVPAPAAP